MTERKPLPVLPFVVVLAALGLVVGARLFLAWLEPAAGPTDLARGERPVSAPQTPGAADDLARPGTAPGAGTDGGGAGEREDVLDAEQEELEASLPVVEGRVVLDHASPADEELFVVDLGSPGGVRQILGGDRVSARVWGSDAEGRVDEGEPTFVRVRPDGTFRIPLPTPESTTAHLALVGRYTSSSRTEEVSVGDEDVVLTGELGAWIVGRLVAPDIEPGDPALAGVPVEMGPDITAGFDTYGLAGVAYDADTETDGEGRFEFRSVTRSFARGLYVQPADHATMLEMGVMPRPGERLELTIELQQGATLRGTVLGPDGGPLAGVPVAARVQGGLGQAIGDVREATTDRDGRFELRNVLTGRRLEVVARPEELRHAKLTTETKLRDRQVMDGLVLTCEAGLEVAGRVLRGDGTPGAELRVRLVTDLASMDPSSVGLAAANAVDRTATTGDDGTFRFAGLRAGKYELSTSEEGKGLEVRQVALASGVEAGRTDLVLQLEPTGAVVGRLQTDSSREITSFRVDLLLRGSGGLMGIGAKRRSREFDGPEDGGFVFDGIAPGEWEVTVSAAGFGATEARLVTVPAPAGAEPELFELVPAAAVAGRVLDTAGKPVSGARVSLELDLGQRIQQATLGRAPSATTDHLGEFLLESVEPGSLSLVAEMQGFAGSEPAPVELASGELREGVDLTLRLGGTVHGEVLDEEGEPASGRMVIVQSMPSYTRQHIATAGPDGEFRFEHLEPGSWQVISMANALTGELEMDEEGGMGEMLKDMKMDVVEVLDGEEHWVSLGRPAQDPVEVIGTVRAGDEPLEDAVVSFVPEASRGLADLRMTTTDEDGGFSIELEKRGAYLVTVQARVGMAQQTSVEFDEVIPEEVTQHRVLLRMPLGGIRGRILGPDGAPAAGARVTLNVDDGMRFGTFLGGNYVETAAGEDGRYELRYLRPGRYAVSAGGVTLGGAFGDSSGSGRAVRSGLKVAEGAWLDGVDFRLEPARELVGRVLGLDGSPVAGAAIFVRDDAGQLLDHFSFTTTDAAGRFVYRGVSEGSYSVQARKGESVSKPGDPVRVGDGREESAEVRLEEGTVLLVKVVDRSGTEFRARVSVVDDSGAEMCGMLTVEEVMQQFGKGFSSTEQRVGPLPPGRYRVTARLDDGRTADRAVTLSGQTERRLTLRVR